MSSTSVPFFFSIRARIIITDEYHNSLNRRQRTFRLYAYEIDNVWTCLLIIDFVLFFHFFLSQFFGWLLYYCLYSLSANKIIDKCHWFISVEWKSSIDTVLISCSIGWKTNWFTCLFVSIGFCSFLSDKNREFSYNGIYWLNE